MDWYYIVAIIAISGILLMIGFELLKRRRYKKIVEITTKKFTRHFSFDSIKSYKPDNVFQMEFDGEKRYLIKLIDMRPSHEVVITNADNVVINENVTSWQRSTKPQFVAGMKPFLKLEKGNKSVIKVVLIYPACHNITKYINECDCYKVGKFQIVDGMYFVKYNDLDDFLSNH